MIGLQLSQYRIDEELGRGGMGIVYRATDTKLNRTVALKVLPASALASQEDRARFFREAQAAAQLSHPNVCHVYQVDEAVPLSSDGSPAQGPDEKRPFIAMEYVRGETLNSIVSRGPLPLTTVIEVAMNVAEALHAAHEEGIVHRDIKSSNVMRSEKGQTKVLDFGLAKTAASTQLTRLGSTVGTVAYMSPEQARGEDVDARTDLYALGTLIYETIAGRLPFPGDYEQAVLYGILNEDPEPLTAIRSGIPMELEALVGKCLAKDREFRYQTAKDLIVDLKRIDVGSGTAVRRGMSTRMGAVAPAPAPQARRSVKSTVALIVAGVLAGSVAGWLLRGPGPEPSRPVRHFQFKPPVDGVYIPVALSPDGRLLVYAANAIGEPSQTYVYDFERGINTASSIRYPVRFSPDGTRFLFAVNGRVGTVGIDGSGESTLVSEDAYDAHWTRSGRIVYQSSLGVFELDPESGARKTLYEKSTAAQMEQMILGYDESTGHLLLGRSLNENESSAWWIDPDAGEERELDDAAYGRGLTGSGHFLYSVGGELRARPIDMENGRFVGPPVALMSNSLGHRTLFSVGGDLVDADLSWLRHKDFWHVSSEGRLSDGPVLTVGSDIDDFRMSSDGRYVAAELNWFEGGSDEIFVYDLTNGSGQRRTYEGFNYEPEWSPDDKQLVFARTQPGRGDDLFIMSADGSGESKRLTRSTAFHNGPDWSEDGRFIVFSASYGMAPDSTGVGVIELETGTMSFIPADRTWKPRVSPDGRYVTFSSRETGRSEIFVASLDGKYRRQLTTEGGVSPEWSPDGQRLFYQRRQSVRSIGVRAGDAFQTVGGEREEFESSNMDGFEVLPDGSGFLISYVERRENVPMDITLNWFAELDRLAPVKR